jgi:hypothetical protein
VAVTSIWHSLPHEADGLGNDEARLGDETALGPTVWISVRVVGTTCVMVSIWVMRMVEIDVEAGIWVVKVVVGPGIVVITTGPGTVAVVGIKVVTILGGNCVVTVVMIGGRVKVETTVEPGSCVVTVPPGKVTTRGGTVKVDTTVLAGRVIVVVVMTGGSVDVLETVTTVVTGGSRDVIVCGGPWTVVTIVEAWKSISHRKGTVPLNSKLSCNGHKLCRPQELPIELPITQRLAIRILLTGKVVVERRVLIDTEICVVVTNCVVATVRVFSVVCVMSRVVVRSSVRVRSNTVVFSIVWVGPGRVCVRVGPAIVCVTDMRFVKVKVRKIVE